jgi:predicted nucleic acid-binding protein
VTSILIDSDILIEVSRGRDAGLVAQWDTLAQSQAVLMCSPVTVAELWHGARPHEHKFLEDLSAVIQCVPIDLEIARRAGEYLRVFAKRFAFF